MNENCCSHQNTLYTSLLVVFVHQVIDIVLTVITDLGSNSPYLCLADKPCNCSSGAKTAINFKRIERIINNGKEREGERERVHNFSLFIDYHSFINGWECNRIIHIYLHTVTAIRNFISVHFKCSLFFTHSLTLLPRSHSQSTMAIRMNVVCVLKYLLECVAAVCLKLKISRVHKTCVLKSTNVYIYRIFFGVVVVVVVCKSEWMYCYVCAYTVHTHSFIAYNVC